MSLFVKLLSFFIFITFVYGYPLGRPLDVLAIDDCILDMLRPFTPWWQPLSKSFGRVLPQVLSETRIISSTINTRDLAASFATTVLGGGLALYFT